MARSYILWPQATELQVGLVGRNIKIKIDHEAVSLRLIQSLENWSCLLFTIPLSQETITPTLYAYFRIQPT